MVMHPSQVCYARLRHGDYMHGLQNIRQVLWMTLRAPCDSQAQRDFDETFQRCREEQDQFACT